MGALSGKIERHSIPAARDWHDTGRVSGTQGCMERRPDPCCARMLGSSHTEAPVTVGIPEGHGQDNRLTAAHTRRGRLEQTAMAWVDGGVYHFEREWRAPNGHTRQCHG
eukprot:scaffold7169_cov26-Tisochrysis_lutea.AAC.3